MRVRISRAFLSRAHQHRSFPSLSATPFRNLASSITNRSPATSDSSQRSYSSSSESTSSSSQSHSESSNSSSSSSSSCPPIGTIVALSGATLAGSYYLQNGGGCPFACGSNNTSKCEEFKKLGNINSDFGLSGSNSNKSFPKYSYDEFIKLGTTDNRIVVAYDNKIFDVTDFSGHPGGVGRLEMANGKDLSVFWKIYTQHNRGHVANDILAVYQIGEFKSSDDMKKVTDNTYYDDSYYKTDLFYPELLVNTKHPYNAEGPLRKLTDSFITPIGRHFVRNHNAVPMIDPEEYRLSVVGEGLNEETIFTLEDLKTKFPKHSVTTVIQCNGNRREDYHFTEYGPKNGPDGKPGGQPAFGPPHWVAGAIGCSTWSGVRLRDLLRASGMDVDAISLRQKEAPKKAVNVGLLAYDQDEVGNQYCCTFPFDKAIDPFGDVLVAYEMNGEDIPRPYGYPVRCIVPGHAGARNCKYLQQVEITDKPCNGNSNWKQYAVHSPDVGLRKIMEFEKYKPELAVDPPVQEMPVQSLITEPAAGDILAVGRGDKKSVYIKGIAWGGGGSAVNRVDVSLDGGENWTRANLLKRPIEQRRRSEWAWQFFEQEIPLSEEILEKLKKGESVQIELCCKALNGAWNVQPATPHGHVNAHGCCVNHWYRVPIVLCPNSKYDCTGPVGDYINKPSGGKFAAPFRHLDQPKACWFYYVLKAPFRHLDQPKAC